MKVLVDTAVWSIRLRRRAGDLAPLERWAYDALGELIREGRALLPGIVRQELLSGLRDVATFDRLAQHLRWFEDPGSEVADHEEAARASNACRTRGVAGSLGDFQICALARRRGLAILTTDRDFERYAEVLGLTLLRP